ncbi:MAG: T9SS type A sorting domain-containing protein, partial [Saprospiraceae bacterium]|nr:T9SS type A sorting domain-containing protein [Saprospiraceae bacterium]
LRLDNPVSITPTLTTDGRVQVHVSAQVKLVQVQIFDSNGRLCGQQRSAEVVLPDQRGVYFVLIVTDRGRFSHKVVRN